MNKKNYPDYDELVEINFEQVEDVIAIYNVLLEIEQVIKETKSLFDKKIKSYNNLWEKENE